MTHDDAFVGTHHRLHADECRTIGEFVRVMARMQIGTADAATQYVDHELSAFGRGIVELRELEFPVADSQCLHDDPS